MENTVCTAGFARLDITPPLGMGMGGTLRSPVSPIADAGRNS